MRTVTFGFVLGLACVVVLWPVESSAQSEIAGVVKDASGSVLPGVTVEAASPALIEKVAPPSPTETATTGSSACGPASTRSRSRLPGFSTVSREGIELTSDFTATVNAEMKVGALEETITVTGESPIVDTQSITARTVMTREVLDALPTGRNIQAVGIMIPGTHLARGRRRRAVARRRRIGNAAAVAAPVSRFGRYGPDDRRPAPQQPRSAGSGTAACTGTTPASRN